MEDFNTENKDKSAFPSTDGVSFAYDGLTKREYFAGLAMQGLMASLTEMRAIGNSINIHDGLCDILAIECVDMADALLKKLNETK